MAEGSDRNYITEEVRAYIGRETGEVPWPEPLDRSSLRRYVQATHDANPLYSDEKFAEASRYGGLIAPPFYLARTFPPPLGEPPVGYEDPGDDEDDEHSVRVRIPGMPRLVNSGSDIEWYRPVYLGDRLYVRTRVADIQEKTGRSGPFALVTMQRTFRNQRGELVAISKQSTIRLP